MNPRGSTPPTAPTRRLRQFLASPVGVLALAVVISLGILVVVVGYFVVFIGASRTDQELEAALVELIHETAPGGSVRVSEATDFDWDAVGILGPFHSRDEVSTAMGVRVSRGVTNWLQYEESCLLVFRHDDHIVAWAVLSRHLVACEGAVVASPAEARLRVILDEVGAA